MGQIILKYIRKHWLMAAVLGYFLFSTVFRVITGINVTIPCLFTTFFGFHCPGCGLTSAFTNLLTLNFKAAWDFNPLIFIVLPFGLFYFAMDFLNFRKRMAKTPA